MRVLITGANRGIGLELVKIYVQRKASVIAACRHASPELTATGAEVLPDVDVTSDASLARLASAVTGPLDILINNAGVLRRESLDDLDLQSIREQFEVNALGPLRVTHALLPRLQNGSKVGIITSRMGSIGDNTSGGRYGYRMSKAAVNIAGVSLARDLRERGIAVALLHPGYVRTDMTGGTGDVSPAESAKGLVARIDDLTLTSSGTFWHAQGATLPW